MMDLGVTLGRQYPGFLAGSTLDMQFARGAYLGATPASLTTVRASDGYAEDSVGNWSLFGANVPRITSKGLLVEEVRTNQYPNNSMQGAVVGVVGSGGSLPTGWSQSQGTGINPEVVRTGVENGIEYIDIRFAGVPSAVSQNNIFLHPASGAAALTGETWTNSAFLSMSAGSLSNIEPSGMLYVMEEQTSGSAFVVNKTYNYSSLITAGPLRRGVQTATLTGGVTVAKLRNRIQFSVINSGVAIDFTIRIGWPQLELGAFATSPIRTTTAAVTRAADAVSLTGGAFSSWYTNANAGTLYTEFVMNYRASGVNKYVSNISDNTASNRATIFVQADGLAYGFRLSNAGSTTFNVNGGTTPLDAEIGKSVFAWDSSTTGNAAVAGTLVGADDATVTAPVSPNRLYFGINETGTAQYLNGYVRRVAYIPSRLTNAELQAITT